MRAVSTGNRDAAQAGPEYGAWVLFRGPFTSRVIRQQWYLFTGFLIAFVDVVLMTVFLTAGSVWLLIAVGVPVLLLGFGLLRRYAERERHRIHKLTGLKVPTPYRERPAQGGWLVRLHHDVADPASWRDLAHLMVTAPLGLGWFIAVVVSWALPAAALTLPFWYRHLPEHRIMVATGLGDRSHLNNLPGLRGASGLLYADSMPGILALCAAGFVFVWLITPALMELATRIQVGVGHNLLGLSRGELERREEALRVTRGQAVSAAEAERRRIERDLHDGAQQRLVALAMDLGMAKAKLKSGDDTEAAAKLVAEAHEGVKLALTELRDLARGIHPAVLTDRGLDAALSALAGRSPIPVEVESALTWRPSPEIESATYFVASECLANMAKHSEATRAWIDLEHVNGHLRLVVGDNGIGGARAEGKGGLNGLADRIAPLDGILSVSSPVGGPTLIVMEIPCQAPKA